MRRRRVSSRIHIRLRSNSSARDDEILNVRAGTTLRATDSLPAKTEADQMDIIGRHVSQLTGYAPTLPTPFDRRDDIDREAFERLCRLQVEAGATALVVCGATGESPTLSAAEHAALITIAVGVARGRIPVIAGAGSNSTARAIDLTRTAEACGADAVLSVVPYYNKPTQAGMCAHFRSIAQSAGVPIILHDVPSRTACGLADETIVRLRELPQIIGLKDATGDVTRPPRLRPLVGAEFRLLSGDDATAPIFLAQGGNGCISVTSNAAPALCRRLFLAHRQQQSDEMQRLSLPLAQLTRILSCKPNPVPLKYALSLLGLMSQSVRLPLVELSPQTKVEVADGLAEWCEESGEQTIGTMSRRPTEYRAVASSTAV
jgi:4-hydroxy-tetrahydrodipicolinate synthase